MISSDLIKYIDNPDLLVKESVAELQQLVKDFPYFQPAHLLLSMASKKWDTSIYQQSLKTTAITVTNRSHLFDLIHSVQETGDWRKVTGDRGQETGDREQGTGNRGQETGQKNPELIKLIEVENFVQEKVFGEKFIEEKKSVAVEMETGLVDEVENEMSKQFAAALMETQLESMDQEMSKAVPTPENFIDWLRFLNLKETEPLNVQSAQEKVSGQKAETEKRVEKRKKASELIDKIIEANPGAIKFKEERKFFTPESSARESLLENEDLVTETLAKIYALQGNVHKAIRAYEILSLRFPQKSVYFAAQIKKLKTES